ncbi:hypothetical protein OC844_007522 [Tilletia horrida]|nr:hypothetical protein OC844_007522 [Tilletia horrida]
MAAPINIRPAPPPQQQQQPHSISLKDRVVRSLSLRRNTQRTPKQQQQHSPSPSASPLPSPSEELRPSRFSLDFHRRPTTSSSSASNINTKASSPLASSSYTADPFDHAVKFQDSAKPHSQKLAVPQSPSYAPPALPTNTSTSTSTTSNGGSNSGSGSGSSSNGKKRSGHGHSQSHNNISLLSRSLSRSKYLGRSGSNSKKDADTTTTTTAILDDSFVVLSPPAIESSPKKNAGKPSGRSRTQSKTQTASTSYFDFHRSSNKQQQQQQQQQASLAKTYYDDLDDDAASTASRRPLIRSRSFDSLVPSLLGDYAPQPRILVESTTRAKPLARIIAPPPRNVFSIQRIPWGQGDDDENDDDGGGTGAGAGAGGGGISGEVGNSSQDISLVADAGDDTRISRERAHTADGRLGLLKSAAAAASPDAAPAGPTLIRSNTDLESQDIVEELSSPFVAYSASFPRSHSGYHGPVSGGQTTASPARSPASSPGLHPARITGGIGASASAQNGGSSAHSSPGTGPVRITGAPGSSPGLNAARITGGAGNGSSAGAAAAAAALREHWTRELEGKKGPFIVVERGWKKGIYTSGEEAAKQIRDFPGPKVRKVESAAEAIDIIAAYQPVTPSPTTAEGLLSRTGSVRQKINMASSYGAAGARASRYLGLDAEEGGEAAAAAAATTNGAGAGSGSGTGAVPVLPPKDTHRPGRDKSGGLSYAARRAARLRAEAEAAAAAATGGGAGDVAGSNSAGHSPPKRSNGTGTGPTDAPRTHRSVPSTSSKHASPSKAPPHLQPEYQLYGRSSMDSARVLAFHDDNLRSSDLNHQNEERSGQERVRDRTRSGGLYYPPTSVSSFSGGPPPDSGRARRAGAAAAAGGLGQGQSTYHYDRPHRSGSSKRPSTATARQGKAAELEYGLLDYGYGSGASSSSRREGSGGGEGRRAFGMAYASALGASVTVQRAHTISGAR